MSRANLYQRLIATLGDIAVYPDFIPQDAALPAVAYLHISELGQLRTLEGGKDARGDTWQIEIIAATRDECDEIANTVSSLDNYSDDHFQRFETGNQRDDPASADLDYRRAFIDITTHNRSVNHA